MQTTPVSPDPTRCPLCGGDNRCAMEVERATGQRPELPSRIGDLFEREERMVELPGDYAAIADYVADHAVARG